jgi:CBS domain-containing protein
MNNWTIKDWIPLANKLVWPIFIVLLLLIFQSQVRQIYEVLLDAMKAGRSIKVGGFLELGELAKDTQISQLSFDNISIEGVGGFEGVVRKGSVSYLEKLQEELRLNPSRKIDTLLITDDISYSTDLVRKYIGTLGLRFVVFQKRDRFDGWINSTTFVAQISGNEGMMPYVDLRNSIIGIRTDSVRSNATAKEVLQLMQELHVDSVPVLDTNDRWLFFANREEILARLMTSILID